MALDMNDEPFDYGLFGRRFLDELLEESLTARPKREVELLILRLILEIGQPKRDPRSLLELARDLRISPKRLQTMINELDFRDPSLNQDLIKVKLREAIEQGEVLEQGGRIHIQIDDEAVRAHAIAMVRQEYGVVDTSFRDDILVLTPEKYIVLAAHALDDRDQEKVRSAVLRSGATLQLSSRKASDIAGAETASGEPDERSFWRAMAETFMEAAAEEAGKQAVQIGFSFATGGLDRAINMLRATLGRRLAA